MIQKQTKKRLLEEEKYLGTLLLTQCSITPLGYVTTLFKLGAIFTILWAWLFLGEGQAHSRLLCAWVMVIGGVLVAM